MVVKTRISDTFNYIKKEAIIEHENMNLNKFCVSVSLWPHQLPMLQPADEPGNNRSKPASVVNLEIFESWNLDITNQTGLILLQSDFHLQPGDKFYIFDSLN